MVFGYYEKLYHWLYHRHHDAVQLQTTITVANGDTTGKEAAIGILKLHPYGRVSRCYTAAANSVTLNDIGTERDTDGFVDGISAAVNSTGFKGFSPVMAFSGCLVVQPLRLQQRQTK